MSQTSESEILRLIDFYEHFKNWSKLLLVIFLSSLKKIKQNLRLHLSYWHKKLNSTSNFTNRFASMTYKSLSTREFVLTYSNRLLDTSDNRRPEHCRCITFLSMLSEIRIIISKKMRSREFDNVAKFCTESENSRWLFWNCIAIVISHADVDMKFYLLYFEELFSTTQCQSHERWTENLLR